MIALSGVRSSWLILARKLGLGAARGLRFLFRAQQLLLDLDLVADVMEHDDDAQIGGEPVDRRDHELGGKFAAVAAPELNLLGVARLAVLERCRDRARKAGARRGGRR